MQNDQMRTIITNIDYKIISCQSKIKTFQKVRDSLQNICNHDFRPAGHDHNYTYEECSICRVIRKAQ